MSGDEPGMTRHEIGSTAPSVPYLTPRSAADRGVAGSLVQARQRQRATRKAAQPPLMRDWRAWCALVVASVVASATLLRITMPGPLRVALVVLAAAVAVALVRARGGRAADGLGAQISSERMTAKHLDLLTDRGWTVLHDRLLPGTEHRVAHLLAGPAGLVVATELPVTDPLRHVGGVLLSGNAPLDAWFTTRWWEARQVNNAIAARLAGWPWTGPVYVVALVPTFSSQTPATYRDVPIRTSADVARWISDLPAPLGRLAAAELAGELEAACPPAATAESAPTTRRTRTTRWR